MKAESDELRSLRNKASSAIGQLMREKKIDEANKMKQEVVLNNEKIAKRITNNSIVIILRNIWYQNISINKFTVWFI